MDTTTTAVTDGPGGPSRRSMLMAGLGLGALAPLGLAATAGPAAAAAAPQPVLTDAQVYGVTTRDPLVLNRADPFVTPRTDGTYFFTGSVPEYDRLVVRGAPTLEGLADAEESVIWRRPTSGVTGGYVWAPELHRIDGRWYVYFAAGDAGAPFDIRMYVVESPLADPRDPAGWSAPREVTTPWGSFKLDATTFTHRGQRYYVWAQAEPEIAVNTSLYIARMSSPSDIADEPVRISTPTLAWERQGFAVNEGAAVLVRNGRVFMTYSASATDARYAMGLLTADEDADLLDPASWSKSPEPVFRSHAPTSRFGPGHNSFTTTPEGLDVMVFHARDYEQITGDPLFDPNRHARAQRLYWAPDGTPLFGVPLGAGAAPPVRLSPVARPQSFVRHRGDVVSVDPNVRELGQTQWRLVPGLDGGATVSVESADTPGSYLRVVDGTARLEALAAGAEGVAQASFVRTTDERGTALQLVGDPRAGWLRHGGRTVTTGRRGALSWFALS